MRFEITVNVQAPLEHVWRCLTDPALVGRCVTGLSSLTEVVPEQAYQALVTFPLGQRVVACQADLAWLSRDAPRAATLAVQVSLAGEAAGTHAVSSHSRLSLTPGEPAHTQVAWQIDIALQGGFAGMPPQLLHPLVQRYSASFFACLKQAIEAGITP